MRKKSKYTMQDVARVAGVSMGTASAVINGSGNVSQSRKERVLDAIQMLDYHPDQVARSLRKGRTHVIGMVIPDLTHEFYPEVIRGAQDAAGESGFSVILCDSKDVYELEREHIRMLRGRRVDGILLACSESSRSRTPGSRTPTVYFDRIPQGEPCLGVATDNFEAAAEATQHLIGLGHQRIALMVGPNRLVPHAQRLEGFRVAMQRAGLPVLDSYLRTGDLSVESGAAIAKELLHLRRPPTAVLVDNNRMLLGLLSSMHEAGISCPGGLSIIAFDDYPWLAHLRPSITVVAQPTYELGRQAALTLVRRIEEGDAEPADPDGVVELKCELKIRDSVGPPCRGAS